MPLEKLIKIYPKKFEGSQKKVTLLQLQKNPFGEYLFRSVGIS